MSTKTEQEAEILATFYTFWLTYAERKNGRATIDDIKAFFDSEVTSIGTGDHEKGRDFDEVVQNFQADLVEMDAPIVMDFSEERVRLITDATGLVEAECMAIIPVEDGEPLVLPLRFSTVFVYKEARWLMVHNHVSIPSDGQGTGEAFPIDELKAKNEKLQNLVFLRTKSLEEKTAQLQQEKERTEQLLYNILPRKVARELLDTGQTVPARFENVSVLFTDFVGFTNLAVKVTPRLLVKELNEIFFQFDEIIKAERLEKIKTIGDSYMAVCGLPEENEAHAVHCIRAARQMLDYLMERPLGEDRLDWRMRIGIHSGPVVAGVVGNHKFTYDLWGNTVNIASRLEGASVPGRINISSQTQQLVAGIYPCEPRGKIEIKGNTAIDMYFVA